MASSSNVSAIESAVIESSLESQNPLDVVSAEFDTIKSTTSPTFEKKSFDMNTLLAPVEIVTESWSNTSAVVRRFNILQTWLAEASTSRHNLVYLSALNRFDFVLYVQVNAPMNLGGVLCVAIEPGVGVEQEDAVSDGQSVNMQHELINIALERDLVVTVPHNIRGEYLGSHVLADKTVGNCVLNTFHTLHVPGSELTSVEVTVWCGLVRHERVWNLYPTVWKPQVHLESDYDENFSHTGPLYPTFDGVYCFNRLDTVSASTTGLFATVPVAPWTSYTGGSKYLIGRCGALALQYAFWRGTMKYRVSFGTSQLEVCRVLVAWHPTLMLVPTKEQLMQCEHFIVNVQHDKVFEFKINWRSAVNYHPVHNGNVTDSPAFGANGFLYFWMVDRLRCSVVSTNPATFLVEMAPDGLLLREPRGIVSGLGIQMLGAHSMKHLLRQWSLIKPELNNNGNPSSNDRAYTIRVYPNANLHELRTELTNPALPAGATNPLVTLPQNKIPIMYLLARYFVGWKGSLEFKFVSTNATGFPTMTIQWDQYARPNSVKPANTVAMWHRQWGSRIEPVMFMKIPFVSNYSYNYNQNVFGGINGLLYVSNRLGGLHEVWIRAGEDFEFVHPTAHAGFDTRELRPQMYSAVKRAFVTAGDSFVCAQGAMIGTTCAIQEIGIEVKKISKELQEHELRTSFSQAAETLGNFNSVCSYVKSLFDSFISMLTSMVSNVSTMLCDVLQIDLKAFAVVLVSGVVAFKVYQSCSNVTIGLVSAVGAFCGVAAISEHALAHSGALLATLQAWLTEEKPQFTMEIASLVVLAVCSTFFNFVPSVDGMRSILHTTGGLGRDIQGTSMGVEKMAKMFNAIKEQITMDDVKREFARQGSVIVAELPDLLTAIEEATAPEKLDRMSLEHLEVVRRLKDKIVVVKRHALKLSLSAVAVRFIEQADRKLDLALSDATYLEMAEKGRVSPYSLQLFGTSQIGKSFALKKIANEVMDHLGYPKTGRFYTKGDSKFYDGWHHQTSIILDDIGVKQGGDGTSTVDCLMDLCSNNELRANMAELKDKGRVVDCHFVWSATNIKDIETIKTNLNYAPAYNARRKCLYECVDNGLARNKTMQHIDFYEMDPLRNRRKEGAVSETYQQVIAKVKVQAKEHLEAQFEAMDMDLPTTWPQGALSFNTALDMIEKEDWLQAVFKDFPGLKACKLNLPRRQYLVLAQVWHALASEYLEDQEFFDAADALSMIELESPLKDVSEYYRKGGLNWQKLIARAYDFKSALLMTPEDIQAREDLLKEIEDVEQEMEVVRQLNLEMGRAGTISAALINLKEALLQRLATITNSYKNFVSTRRIAVGCAILVALPVTLKLVSKVLNHWFTEEPEVVLESNPVVKVKPRKVYKLESNEVKIAKQRKVVRLESADVEIEDAPLMEDEYLQFADNEIYRCVQPQLVLDRTAHDIAYYKIVPNIVDIETPDAQPLLKGIMVDAMHLLVPYHVVVAGFDEIVMRTRTAKITLELSRMVVCRFKSPRSDCCLLKMGIPVPGFKSVVKYFMSKQEHSLSTPMPGYLLIKRDIGNEVVIDCQNAPSVVPSFETRKYKIPNGEEVVITGYSYYAQTMDGDCGSPLIIQNTRTVGKVAGIHVCGTRDGHKVFGGSELVCREELEEAIGINVELPDMMRPDVPMKSETYVKEGTLVRLGSCHAQGVPHVPEKTGLVASGVEAMDPRFGKEPSILSKRDERLAANEYHDDLRGVFDPGHVSILKYSGDLKSLPQDKLVRVGDHLTELLQPFKSGVGFYEIETAVNGIPGDDLRPPMNLSTSPGYPYVLEKCGPKRNLFELRADGYHLSSDKLIERYNKVATGLLEGRREPVICIECPKDEKLVRRKIYEKPKTRTFSIMPTEITILFRQFFLDMVATMSAARYRLDCQVGINPLGSDWSQLMARLREVSDVGFAADYTGFDGNLHPQLFHVFVKVVNSLFPDSYGGLRSLLIMYCYDRYTLVGFNLFLVKQGLGSGFPITAVVNSFCNMVFLRLAWLLIMEEKCKECADLVSFEENVRVAVYGDDNVVAVARKFIEIYNCQTVSDVLARYGVKMTDDSKSDVIIPYKQLDECTFLKRSFKPDGKRYMAPLERNSLVDRFSYFPKTMSFEDYFMGSYREFLAEAMFHGEEFFQQSLDHVKGVVKRFAMVEPQFPTYKELYLRWLNGHMEFSNAMIVPQMMRFRDGFRSFNAPTSTQPIQLSGLFYVPVFSDDLPITSAPLNVWELEGAPIVPSSSGLTLAELKAELKDIAKETTLVDAREKILAMSNGGLSLVQLKTELSKLQSALDTKPTLSQIVAGMPTSSGGGVSLAQVQAEIAKVLKELSKLDDIETGINKDIVALSKQVDAVGKNVVLVGENTDKGLKEVLVNVETIHGNVVAVAGGVQTLGTQNGVIAAKLEQIQAGGSQVTAPNGLNLTFPTNLTNAFNGWEEGPISVPGQVFMHTVTFSSPSLASMTPATPGSANLLEFSTIVFRYDHRRLVSDKIVIPLYFVIRRNNSSIYRWGFWVLNVGTSTCSFSVTQGMVYNKFGISNGTLSSMGEWTHTAGAERRVVITAVRTGNDVMFRDDVSSVHTNEAFGFSTNRLTANDVGGGLTVVIETPLWGIDLALMPVAGISPAGRVISSEMRTVNIGADWSNVAQQGSSDIISEPAGYFHAADVIQLMFMFHSSVVRGDTITFPIWYEWWNNRSEILVRAIRMRRGTSFTLRYTTRTGNSRMRGWLQNSDLTGVQEFGAFLQERPTNWCFQVEYDLAGAIVLRQWTRRDNTDSARVQLVADRRKLVHIADVYRTVLNTSAQLNYLNTTFPITSVGTNLVIRNTA